MSAPNIKLLCFPQVINQVPFVTINSMAFEGDDCFLCKPAVKAVNELKEVLLKFTRVVKNILILCRNSEASPHQSFSPTSRFTGSLTRSVRSQMKLLRMKKKPSSEKGADCRILALGCSDRQLQTLCFTISYSTVKCSIPSPTW